MTQLDYAAAAAPAPQTLADRLLGPTRPAGVDRLRHLHSFSAQAVAIVGFALLTGLAAQFEWRPAGWSVPITLQTLVIYGSGLYLGWRNGMLASALYLVLGLFLPFYSGGGSGAEHLFGVTGGYLMGYLLAPAVGGLLTKRWNGPVGTYLSLLASSVTLFTCGVTWLWLQTDLSLEQAVWQGWGVFVLIDLVKLLAVAVVYSGTRAATRR